MVDIGFAYDHPHLHNYHVIRYCNDTGSPLSGALLIYTVKIMVRRDTPSIYPCLMILIS